mmetsp:Transcript_34038/g.94201  ORF Transcript_34038/g.94201 Transcript_34038/m.94201 type:complete len:157 (-) Transcript_34038:72-542(-)
MPGPDNFKVTARVFLAGGYRVPQVSRDLYHVLDTAFFFVGCAIPLLLLEGHARSIGLAAVMLHNVSHLLTDFGSHWADQKLGRTISWGLGLGWHVLADAAYLASCVYIGWLLDETYGAGPMAKLFFQILSITMLVVMPFIAGYIFERKEDPEPLEI